MPCAELGRMTHYACSVATVCTESSPHVRRSGAAARRLHPAQTCNGIFPPTPVYSVRWPTTVAIPFPRIGRSCSHDPSRLCPTQHHVTLLPTHAMNRSALNHDWPVLIILLRPSTPAPPAALLFAIQTAVYGHEHRAIVLYLRTEQPGRVPCLHLSGEWTCPHKLVWQTLTHLYLEYRWPT